MIGAQMKMISYVVIALLALSSQVGLIQTVMAAETETILQADQQRIGTINSIDLQRSLIVIDDAEFRMSDNIVIHGRNSGSKLSLSKGMKVKFSPVPAKDRYVIDEVWISQ